MNRTPSIFSIVTFLSLFVVLTACGGGGGGGSDNSEISDSVAPVKDSEISVPVTPVTKYTPDYTPGIITLANAENLVKEADLSLKHLVNGLVIDVVGVETIDPDNLLPSDLEISELLVDLNWMCENEGGSFKVEFMQSPVYDSFIHGMGEQFVISEDNCEKPVDGVDYFFQGDIGFKVIEGYIGSLNGLLVSADADYQMNTNLRLLRGSQTEGYEIGDIRRAFTGSKLSISGKSFQSKSVSGPIEYMISNYELMLEGSALNSLQEYLISTDKKFILGLANADKSTYDVEILEPLTYQKIVDSSIYQVVSGRIRLSSPDDSLEVEYFPDYLTYLLDLGQDDNSDGGGDLFRD